MLLIGGLVGIGNKASWGGLKVLKVGLEFGLLVYARQTNFEACWLGLI